MNSVSLSGRLGKEVEVAKTNNGVSVCRFSLAVNKGYGEKRKTSWIECVAWRQSADFLFQYARKGDMVGVNGELTVDEYTNRDGNKVYKTYVNCDNVELYSSKPKGEYKSEEPKASSVGDEWKQPTLGGELSNADDKEFNFDKEDLPFL